MAFCRVTKIEDVKLAIIEGDDKFVLDCTSDSISC